MSHEFRQTLTVKHPNTMSSLKDDANRIYCWKNVFNRNAYFKLESKEDVLSQDGFPSFKLESK